MTPEQLAAIKARTEAATKGPWSDRDSCLVLLPDGEPLCEVLTGEATDQAFIAHARTDIPDLLAEMERLTADRDWTTKTLRWIRSYLSIHSDSVHNPVTDSVLDAIAVALSEPVEGITRAWVEFEVNALGDEEGEM